jgi:uncharacterized protein (DUF1778 family)
VNVPYYPAAERARAVLEEHARINLDAEAHARFAAALANPPQPPRSGPPTILSTANAGAGPETPMAAPEKLDLYEHLTLVDPRDREAFVDAMLNPPMPSVSLREAAQRYRETADEHSGGAPRDHRWNQ